MQTEIIARWTAASAPLANRVVGSIVADLTRSPGRNTEGVLANVIADAQLAATAAPENGGAQIALMNPGGVRADLTVGSVVGGEQPGEVTYGEAFAVQPFGNTLVTMDLTGEQLQRLLEQQAASSERGQLIFGVSEGFTFEFLPEAGPTGWIPDESVQLDGVPIDPAATYRVTANSFLAGGGDRFSVFTEGTNRLVGDDDLEAFIADLAANSPVAPPPDRIAGV